MTFAQMNLDPSISKAIHVCGYKDPTPVQKKSIPEILNGNDLIACAQTGTGKTAAFVLPALHRLSLQQTARKPRILILTPTRELASQITGAAAKYGKFLRFNMASLVGGMSYRQQLKELSRAVDMIVATPGRLLDHMENRRVDLSGIEMLILDEADRMLDMGFIDDVQAIAKVTPKNRQTLLFSATVDGRLNHVIKSLLKEPIRIDLSQEKISPAQIKQELYYSDNPQHKARLLQHFLTNENIFKAIIFSATKIGADRLANQLCDQGYLAAPLHGDLKQSMRNRTIEQLRRGKIQFLVATDVAARGIDIADMTHVINYDLPRFCEDYVHRIGRTGRAGKSGVAISFALPSDTRHVLRIEQYIGKRLESLVIPGLEPSHKPRSAAPAAPGGKKRKKSSGGFKKSSYGKSEDGRFGGRGEKPKFGGHAKSSYGKSDEGRSSFGRSERPKSGYAKSSYGKSDDRKSSFDRSERPKSGYAKSSYGKSDDRKSGFSRSERPKSGYAKSSYDKSDDSRYGFGRSERPKYGKSDKAKSSFDRSDKPSYAKKSGFGKGKPRARGKSKKD